MLHYFIFSYLIHVFLFFLCFELCFKRYRKSISVSTTQHRLIYCYAIKRKTFSQNVWKNVYILYGRNKINMSQTLSSKSVLLNTDKITFWVFHGYKYMCVCVCVTK